MPRLTLTLHFICAVHLDPRSADLHIPLPRKLDCPHMQSAEGARGVDGAVATTARDAMRDARACAVDIDESAKRPSMRPSCRVGSDVEGGPDTVISLAGASARDFPRVGAIFYSRRRRSPRAR